MRTWRSGGAGREGSSKEWDWRLLGSRGRKVETYAGYDGTHFGGLLMVFVGVEEERFCVVKLLCLKGVCLRDPVRDTTGGLV